MAVKHPVLVLGNRLPEAITKKKYLREHFRVVNNGKLHQWMTRVHWYWRMEITSTTIHPNFQSSELLPANGGTVILGSTQIVLFNAREC